MPLWVKYTSIQIIPQYCVNEIEVLIIRYMYDTLKVTNSYTSGCSSESK